MGRIKAVIALLSGLKLLSWVRFIPLPGLGWIGGAASGALAVAGTVIGAAFKGLTVIFANPVTLVTVGAVAMTALATGLHMGSREGVRRVEKAEQERVAAYATAEQRAKEALAARQAAEAAEAKLAAVLPKLDDRDDEPRKSRPRRVRAKPKVEPDSDRPWMFGVPAVSW